MEEASSASPKGTVTDDGPASPNSATEGPQSPMSLASPSNSQSPAPEASLQEPQSPLHEASLDGPQSPLPEASLDGPLSPLPEASLEGPQSPLPESALEGPQSPLLESSLDGPQSPLPEASLDGPLSPLPEASLEGPQSPLPESTLEGPQSPVPESSVDGPKSPKTDAMLDKPESPNPEASLGGPQSPTPDTAQSPEQETSRESSPRLLDSDSNSKSHADKLASGDDSDIESKDTSTPSKKSKRVESSDSEEETTPVKRRLVSSDSEDDEPTPVKKRKHLDSSGSGEDFGEDKERGPQSPNATPKKETGDGDVIADIFGDSSDEEEEFEGFDEAEIKSAAAIEAPIPEVSSEDELEDDRPQKEEFVSDFDSMMAAKKAERGSGRRKKRNVDIINDNDDLIVEMLRKMKEAADEDRELNKNHQPATRKLTMLPVVTRQLNKAELQTAFMDCGLLSALTEWLAPLPDKSLPHLSIRQSLLKTLTTLPHPHTDQLKSSGIGKAIMYLFKHPKEMRANRDIAGRLINEWSRPIFGQSSNFKSVNREDLQRRDMKTLKNRRRSSEDTAKQEEEQKGLRPGDPGWIYRARVPRPSNRDYVVRPESNVDSEAVFSKSSSKKKKSRYDTQKQKMDNKKKALKTMTAVKISIEGNKMSL